MLPSLVQYVVSECKHCFNLFFENSFVEFSQKQTNEVDHTLARVTTSLAPIFH